MGSARNHDDQTLLKLSAYLDGSLDAAARSELERELERDEVLRAELDAFRRVDQLARQHGGSMPAVDWDRFTWQARARREAYERSRGWNRVIRLWRPLAAAAVIAIAVTATFVWRGAPAPREAGVIAPADRALAVVTVTRRGAADGSLSGRPVAVVTVSRTLPADAIATVGPVPRGRSLIVAVADSGAVLDDEETGSVF